MEHLEHQKYPKRISVEEADNGFMLSMMDEKGPEKKMIAKDMDEAVMMMKKMMMGKEMDKKMKKDKFMMAEGGKLKIR